MKPTGTVAIGASLGAVSPAFQIPARTAGILKEPEEGFSRPRDHSPAAGPPRGELR